MFQVHPLAAGEFSYLSGLSEAELVKRNIQVHVSDGRYPCRVSLADAAAGERVFLLNYEHQPNESPYRSRHAIFVKEGAEESLPAPNTLPASISSRLLSIRAFNARHEIVDAEVVAGTEADTVISAFLENPAVDYIHLHYAGRGCFAAKVTRAAG